MIDAGGREGRDNSPKTKEEPEEERSRALSC